MNYIALLHKEENSDFGVSFPDFPGCITAAPTLEEARKEAKEALLGHIEVMKEEGEYIPTPSSLDDIMNEKENRDAVAFIVEAPSSKSVRVNVTFTEETLALIDRYAKQNHLSRSAFLAMAAENMHNSADAYTQ